MRLNWLTWMLNHKCSLTYSDFTDLALPVVSSLQLTGQRLQNWRSLPRSCCLSMSRLPLLQ